MVILTCKLFKNIKEIYEYIYPNEVFPDKYHHFILKIANDFIIENNRRPSYRELTNIICNKWANR